FFYESFSRIIRGKNGAIIRSVEFKDASAEEKKVLEVNPCYFVFKADWMWARLEKLENKNVQGEYYLTDLLAMAISEGVKINTVPVAPEEALAANSKEELEMLEKR